MIYNLYSIKFLMKKALITGASSGIGLVFAKKLSKDYDITLVSNEKEKLKEALRLLSPGNHKIIFADLTIKKDIENVCNILKKEKYNLLINNAGVASYGNFKETDINKLNKIISLNCNAVMILSHAYLKNAKHGDALIILSSALAFLPSSNGAVYAATKAFDSILGLSLWYQEKANDIYVMVLHPGITRTDIYKKSGFIKSTPRFITETPEQVVENAIKELKKRKKPIVISGRKNKFFVLLSRLFSRKSIIKLMDRF